MDVVSTRASTLGSSGEGSGRFGRDDHRRWRPSGLLAVESFAPRRIAENGPCLVHDGHQLLIATEVRVMPSGKTAIRHLDRVPISVVTDAKDLVRVAHRGT